MEDNLEIWPSVVIQKLFVRAPLFNYSDFSLANMTDLLKNNYFLTSLYLANPSFFDVLERKKISADNLSQKEMLTVQKYYNRMCFRPTPFGTFSSFCVLAWTESDGHIMLKETSESKLHLQIDFEILQSLKGIFDVGLAADDLYYINPTLYKLGNEFRFIRTDKADGETKNNYSLQAFAVDQLMLRIMRFIRIEKSVHQICEFIESITKAGRKETMQFIAYLIEAQIIKNKKGLRLLGADWSLSQFEKKVTGQKKSGLLADIIIKSKTLLHFPQLEQIRTEASYLEKKLNLNLEKSQNLFYANLERDGTGSISTIFQRKITDAVRALSCLTYKTDNPSLNDFIKKFQAQYDRQSVPLLKALDPEAGINYGPSLQTVNSSTLLQHINFEQRNPQANRLEWTEVHKFLMSKWMQSGTSPIAIEVAELTELKNARMYNDTFATSTSVLFNVSDDTLLVETAGGISATSLIGRFTPFNQEILNYSKEIAGYEKGANPDIIFAEIGQISDAHIDNINRRIPVYDYEISINESPCPGLTQIRLDDLYLRVANGELVLESKKLKKRIIPRLTSAYNHQNNELSIFRFLCDLPYQGVHDNFQFDLEQLFPGLSYYPRVVCGGAVLSLAKWKLSRADIKSFVKGQEVFDKERFDLWRRQTNIGPVISMGINDRQLVFNLNDSMQVRMFLNSLPKFGHTFVREFLLPAKTGAVSGGQPILAQFVGVIINPKPTYRSTGTAFIGKTTAVKRTFNIGSEWIYLKIYCKPEIANRIITEKIHPLLSGKLKRLINKWFFIRYVDTGYHLRIRIHTSKTNLGAIISEFELKLSDSLKYNLIREYQADTYHREIERYGSDVIEQVENIFFRSSMLTAALILRLGDSQTMLFNSVFAFRAVNDLLNHFLTADTLKMSFLWSMAQGLMYEYKSNIELKVELDKKYREVQNTLSTSLYDNNFYEKIQLTQENQDFTLSLTQLIETLKLKKSTNDRFTQMLADLIHMHLNRLFLDKQRDQELVVYYCLFKHYQSKVARLVSKTVK